MAAGVCSLEDQEPRLLEMRGSGSEMGTGCGRCSSAEAETAGRILSGHVGRVQT